MRGYVWENFNRVALEVATQSNAITALQTTGTTVLDDGAVVTLDASKGPNFRLVATGNRTIAIPTNAVDGRVITIIHKALGANRTLSLTAGVGFGGFRFGTDFAALSATTSGKTDYIRAVYNAVDLVWDVLQVTKGF